MNKTISSIILTAVLVYEVMQWKMDARLKKCEINTTIRTICNNEIISRNDFKRAESLIEKGADPNQMSLGSSALLFDVANGYERPEINSSKLTYRDKLFILLLDHGADPNISDWWQEVDPLLALGLNTNIEISLLNHGADPEAQCCGRKVLDILLSHKISLDQKISSVDALDAELVKQAIDKKHQKISTNASNAHH